MHSLSQFLIEANKELEEISDYISQLTDIQDLMDKISSIGGERDDEPRNNRYQNMIFQKLMNDPEINSWFDSPYSSEYELKKILSRKLNAREIQYMDSIVDELNKMSRQDNDPVIVNNIVMRIVDDPEMVEWFSDDPTNSEFKGRAIIKKKLRGKEKKFFEPVCRKIMRIANNDHLGDDYFFSNDERRR